MLTLVSDLLNSTMSKVDPRLAEIAADSGFDCLWSTEHHFNDYSFVPDNIHLMTHLAAKHPGIDVGTAAVILPWHNPLRVAENAAVLDLLSNGRLRLGFGRGLARREFEAFGISMDESRGRFDEAGSQHLMTHLAAKHPDIDVGTAAVILPWHDPLRVAENAAVLDLLSNGRGLRHQYGRIPRAI